MCDPARMQARNTKQHVLQYLLHSRDRNISVLVSLYGILNAGAEQFCHKTEMLSIVIATRVDKLSQKFGTMIIRSH